MAEGNIDVKPNSSGGWTFPPIFSWAAIGPGRSHFPEQAAWTSLMGLEIMESWLAASRQMVDLWRQSVREIQDRSFASYRKQIADAVAREVLAELDGAEPAPASRQPRSRTALAKTSAVQTG